MTEPKKRGPSNPKTSPWYSPKQDDRLRKKKGLVMSPEASEALKMLARRAELSESALVEALVLAAYQDTMVEAASVVAGARLKKDRGWNWKRTARENSKVWRAAVRAGSKK